MATQTLVFEFLPLQTPVTATLIPLGSDTPAVAAAACTEATNGKGLYSFQGSNLVGDYTLHIFLDGVALGTGFFQNITNVEDTFYENVALAIDAINITPSVVIPQPVATAQQILYNIVLTRGETLRRTFENLGDRDSVTESYFTVKESYDHEDSEAIIQISQSGGLITFNGKPHDTTANGSITIIAEVDNNDSVTIYISETILKQLNYNVIYYYDYRYVDGDVVTPFSGQLTMSPDITRKVS